MKEFKLTRATNSYNEPTFSFGISKDLPPNPRGGYRSQGVQWTDSNEG